MISKLLVIPDCHASPSYDNERFDALGEFIVRERPTHIHFTGDFACMPSLSSYDKGRRSFEGRRYSADVDATRDALTRLFSPLDRLNRAAKSNHKQRYSPEMTLDEGNHEHRIHRATQLHPELHGALSLDDLGYSACGIQVFPYMEAHYVGGFRCCHNFQSPGGREIGGDNLAATLIGKLHESAIVGHSHIKDYATRVRDGGQRMVAISAGCYINDESRKEEWCRRISHRWWNGVVVLEHVSNGDAEETRFVSQAKIMAGQS